MIKIDVISGFLGAGKTTLIKKLFESKFNNEKIVLIENEFGEIGIDGAFLKESGVEIKEINSGCICCSLVGDFSTSMKEVITKFSPDRIIVEPSGVGKLSDIVNAIKKVDVEGLTLNILATVVDGPKTKIYLKNFGEFFNDQVDAADTVIINKIEKMDEAKLLEVVELVKEKNPKAAIITTPISQIDAVKLLEILEKNVTLKEELLHMLENEHHHDHDEHDDEDDDEECCCHHHHHEHDDHDEDDDDEECCCHHHHHDHEDHDDHDDDDDDEECCCHHHHHDHDDHDDEEEHHHHHHHHHHGHDADEIFTSWGIETAKSISKNQLEEFLNALANDTSLGIVVRSKGILQAKDNEKWYYFDFVSGDYEIRLGEPDYTGRICVIGSKLDENKIKELFNK